MCYWHIVLAAIDACVDVRVVEMDEKVFPACAGVFGNRTEDDFVFRTDVDVFGDVIANRLIAISEALLQSCLSMSFLLIDPSV
jgi:hypothetical protein